MKRVCALTVVFLLCLSAFAFGEREVISIAMDPADKLNLNPYTASDSDSVVVLQNLYEGLFEYDAKTSEPKASIAKFYSVSSDGLVWTFTLDQNARFSDKTKITAQTFIDSWNYLKLGPLSANLDFLDYAIARGEYVLEVHLKYAISYLPSLLCQPCLAAINPSKTGAFSGAYVITKNSTGGLSLRLNKYYRSTVGNDGIDIVFTKDCAQKLKKGEIQWSMAYVEDCSEYIIHSPMYATTFFYFSSSDGVWANETLRKALVQIIPWNAVKAIQQGLLVTDSLVPESNASYSEFASYRKLLSDAGYPNGEGLGQLKIGVHRGSQVALIAELISRLWTKYLGIEVSIDTVPITVYTTDPASNPYDFCIMTWIGDYLDPMAFLSMFDSESNYNIANYSNPEFDLLLQAARTADPPLRAELLSQAEQILLDDCVVVPLSNAISTNFVRSDLIKGWYDNKLDIHPFKELSR